jgi:hypothetical protein
MPVNIVKNPNPTPMQSCSTHRASFSEKEAIMRGHESKQIDRNRRNDGWEENQKRGEDTNPLHARRGNPQSKRQEKRWQKRSGYVNRIRRKIVEARASQSVEETSMKTQINVEELERTIDFEAVGKKLLGLAESGGFKRRKTVADLLGKVRGALLKARDSGASTAALATFLRESGIPVSEATLRQYLRAQGASKRPRRQPARKSTAGPQPSGEAKPQPEPQPEAKPVQNWIEQRRAENPPAAREPFAQRSRGPRVADPKNV